jgi:hypothetical protein
MRANTQMKTEAIMDTYNKLDLTEKYQVDKVSKRMVAAIKSKSPNSKITQKGAIELLGKVWLLKLMSGKEEE